VIQAEEDTVSRLALIVVSLVVGVVLAVGAVYTATGLLSSPPAPVSKPFSYGSP
jgi:hypothetical protein